MSSLPAITADFLSLAIYKVTTDETIIKKAKQLGKIASAEHGNGAAVKLMMTAIKANSDSTKSEL